MILAIAVFVVVLFVFATDMAHRTPAALAGAVLLVVAGAIGQEEAIAGPDLFGGNTRRAVGLPGQRHDRAADVPGYARHRPDTRGGPDPLPHSRGARLEHRGDGHA